MAAWLQISLTISTSQCEAAECILESLGAVSVTFTDAGDQPIFEPERGTTPLWDSSIATGLFEEGSDTATLRNQLSKLLNIQLDAIQAEVLPDQDWTRSWMDRFEPMTFGDKLCICPHGFEPPEGYQVVWLDPGLAFGTGTHPTTRLCLQWLDANADFIQNQTVIDYGCGSGILALGAAKLGAITLHCVDNDPQALTATASNAEQNHVSGKFKNYLPDDFSNTTAPIVLANILANPLIDLAPRIAALVEPNGHLVLSGILAEQAEQVKDAYAEWFPEMAIQQDEDWIRLAGKKIDGQTA